MKNKKIKKIKRINYLKRHSRKLLQRRNRYKIKKKKRNNANNISKEEKKSIRNIKLAQQHGYKIINAPQNFSLTKNTEETLKFMGKVRACFEKKEKVYINLRNVAKISSGAVVVLLSILTKFNTEKIRFNGNFPKDKIAHRNLRASGFIDYLRENEEQPQQPVYSFSREICTHADKKVDADLSDKLIKNASAFIWGKERACRGVQRIFVELMQNTNNHASQIPGEQYWWASVKPSLEDTTVRFSFIDYGMGIFDSLANKKEDSKFAKIGIFLKTLVASDKNEDVLKQLVEGEIHKIAGISYDYYRGKGLPGIWNACNNNAVSNLIIISENAMADFSKKEFKKLKNKLSGTFIYWELNKDNENKELDPND